MATPDDIPTDLTLEIGENLPPERFMAAARAFFGYVDEVSESVAADGEKPAWIVRVRDGSHLIGVAPATIAPSTGLLAAIYGKAESGLAQLAAGSVENARLSDSALKHLRVLAELTDGTHGKPVPVRLWVKKRPLAVVPEVAHVIREDAKVAFNAYGTLEGRLRAIQEQGSLQLQLRDEMLGQTIKAYLGDEMLPEAFANFRKRVEVAGLIHYRHNGVPISIEVGRITALPEDAELPGHEDVRGLLRTAV